MKIDGTLKANELRVGRITIDWLREPIEVSALAGLVNNDDGQTVAWTKARGIWGDDTRDAINKVRELMERDIVKSISASQTTGAATGKGLEMSGIAEHLDDGAPSV